MTSRVNASSPVMLARTALLEAIAKHKRAELSLVDLNTAADLYIAAIRAHGISTGRKVPAPSRAKVIRALS